MVVVLLVAPLSRPASAVWTPDKCDIEGKYWCYAVYYYTYPGGVQLSNRYYWGGLGVKS